MLLEIDKYPFDGNKRMLKDSIKKRFIYYALYYGSPSFAEKHGLEYTPFEGLEELLEEARRVPAQPADGKSCAMLDGMLEEAADAYEE